MFYLCSDAVKELIAIEDFNSSDQFLEKYQIRVGGVHFQELSQVMILVLTFLHSKLMKFLIEFIFQENAYLLLFVRHNDQDLF
jgi:hypothetical protein